MANYNARDFLRDTIAGDVGNGISQSVNMNKNIEDSLIVLAINGQLDDNSVAQILEKYSVSLFNVADDAQEAAYFIWLEAMSFYEKKEWNKSIELFITCFYFDNNWIYEGFLGINLSLLDNYQAALKFLGNSVKHHSANIKTYQQLESNVDTAKLFSQITQYLTLSLFASQQHDLAYKWLDYINTKLSPDPFFQIKIAEIVGDLNQPSLAIKLIKQALPQLEKISDSEQKKFFLNLSKNILQSSSV